jgi:hypothetical protein
MRALQKVRVIVAKEEGLPLTPEGSNSAKRDIPKGHEFSTKAIKPLARTLFSTSMALGHAVSAYKEFTRAKSSNLSPDGMLGGKGYVLKVAEVRVKLQEACELLSTLTDTLHDEINADHWKPRIKELPENEGEDVVELIDRSDRVLDDPEDFGDKAVEKVEAKNDGEEASQLPGAGSKEEMVAAPPATPQVKQSAWKVDANSSLPVTTLPGPRVDHLDRGDQTGPGGSYNEDEPRVEDDWGLSDGVKSTPVNYVWGSVSLGESLTPTDSDTRTEVDDFGIGYGARGQGPNGYSTKFPDGKGVFGPQSGLPDGNKIGWGSVAESGLPFDGPDPVARSDYYQGDKGNQFNVTRSSESLSESEIPEGYNVSYDSDKDLPNTSIVHEQLAVPYVKRDWSTHNDRNDLQDLYRINNE